MSVFDPMPDYDELYGDASATQVDNGDAIESQLLIAKARARSAWTADELLEVEFPEPRWAVPGLLAEGLNLLVGAPKLGKSWLALNIGVAVASGGVALGKVPVVEGDVLYLALEDTGRRLQSRLRSVLAGAGAPKRLFLATECAVLPDGGADRITHWLDDHTDARLVIVDVFTKVRGTAVKDASRYDADYVAMAQIKSIADRYGVAFCVVHHTRKAASEDFLDTVSGTNGLAGAADAILVLTRSRGSSDATVKITGRDVEEADHPLAFDSKIGTWTLLDGPASDYEVSDERRRIIAAVRETPGLSPKAIADASGVKHDVVKHLVRTMVDAGQLETDGAGHYSEPPHSPFTPFTPSLDGEHSEQSEGEEW